MHFGYHLFANFPPTFEAFGLPLECDEVSAMLWKCVNRRVEKCIGFTACYPQFHSLKCQDVHCIRYNEAVLKMLLFIYLSYSINLPKLEKNTVLYGKFIIYIYIKWRRIELTYKIHNNVHLLYELKYLPKSLEQYMYSFYRIIFKVASKETENPKSAYWPKW